MTDGGGGQWKLNLRLVGEALGRTNDAERLLTDYDREAAAASRRGDPGERRAPRLPSRAVAVVAATADGGLRFAKRDSFAGTIRRDAGVAQVAHLADAELVLLSAIRARRAACPAASPGVDAALWWGDGGAFAARPRWATCSERWRSARRRR